MADFVLKYADWRGQIHHQVASAGSEKELREKYAQQGFLIYSIKVRSGGVAFGPSSAGVKSSSWKNSSSSTSSLSP